MTSGHPSGEGDRERRVLSRRAMLGLGLAQLFPGGGERESAEQPRRPAPMPLPSTGGPWSASWWAAPPGELDRRLSPAAAELVAACVIEPGMRVLDIGAGDGNAALAAAGRGARVTACDVAPAAVAAGRARSGAEVEWVEADAQTLPFPDGTFDCALSAFGVTFAPHARQAVAELLRVVRPGGTVAVAAWAEDGFMGGVLDAAGRYLLPPPGGVRPSRWGRRDTLEVLLGEAGAVEVTDHAVMLECEDEDELWELVSDPPGPVDIALGRLDGDSRAVLREEVLALAERHALGDGPHADVEVGYVIARATAR